ncbi:MULTISPECIES: rhomboid-like protein [unclassified Streptomyces]|uniref:rhomboid-like protein n=1 Tax=unclassified Streptomyces TaxID=2593676 RepID=UPI0036E7A05B
MQSMRRFPHAVWSYVRHAPGTYLWLAALFLTTVAMHHMDPHFEHEFLRQRSTNLQELSTNPVRVFVASLFWIDGSSWWPYAVLYTVFHAQAERWLDTWRWLVVVAAAHVLATVISQGFLLWAIREGHAPPSSVNSLDVGVSYALAGVVGVLTYRLVPPLRYVYLAVALVVYGGPLVTGRTFTDLGHFVSVLIGLACHPLVHDRGAPWNPLTLLRRRNRPARRTDRPRTQEESRPPCPNPPAER